MKSDFIPVTGLWESQSKNGNTYWSARARKDIVIPAGANIMVFKKRQDKSGSPAYEIVYTMPQEGYVPSAERPQAQAATNTATTSGTSQGQTRRAYSWDTDSSSDSEEDIPF